MLNSTGYKHFQTDVHACFPISLPCCSIPSFARSFVSLTVHSSASPLGLLNPNWYRQPPTIFVSFCLQSHSFRACVTPAMCVRSSVCEVQLMQTEQRICSVYLVNYPRCLRGGLCLHTCFLSDDTHALLEHWGCDIMLLCHNALPGISLYIA